MYINTFPDKKGIFNTDIEMLWVANGILRKVMQISVTNIEQQKQLHI